MKRFHRRSNPPIPLPFPVAPTLRVAQLSPGPLFRDAVPVVLRRWAYIPSFAPNVVIGFTNEVQHLAEVSALGALDTSAIDHAVVAITRYGMQPLTDRMRVTIWQAFGVPIFELYVGPDYSLLAAECEAHEGWHVAPGIHFTQLETGELVLDGAGNSGLRTGLSATLDGEACACGLAGPRLLNIVQLRRIDPGCLAASA